jgi:hypothetical protein
MAVNQGKMEKAKISFQCCVRRTRTYIILEVKNKNHYYLYTQETGKNALK